MQESQATNPDVAEVLTNNVYMDDICDSVDTIEEAHRLSQGIDSVLAKGGFSTKGWISNKDLTKNKKEISDVTEVFKGREEEGKVLGIVWNQKVDELRFKVKADWFNVSEFTEQVQVKLTKR